MQGFPACRWRKTIHRIVFLAPLFSSNFNTCTSGANFTYARGHKLHLRLNPQTSLFWQSQNNFTASARLHLSLRFVFVCIRLVVLAASFVGACTARPSFCNSYSFAEADDQWSPLPFPSYLLLLTCKRTLALALRTSDGRSSQATRYYGGFGWLASVTPSFPDCRWRKKFTGLFFLLPLWGRWRRRRRMRCPFPFLLQTCTISATFIFAVFCGSSR